MRKDDYTSRGCWQFRSVRLLVYRMAICQRATYHWFYRRKRYRRTTLTNWVVNFAVARRRCSRRTRTHDSSGASWKCPVVTYWKPSCVAHTALYELMLSKPMYEREFNKMLSADESCTTCIYKNELIFCTFTNSSAYDLIIVHSTTHVSVGSCITWRRSTTHCATQ